MAKDSEEVKEAIRENVLLNKFRRGGIFQTPRKMVA